MRSNNTLLPRAGDQNWLRIGLCIGMAGGLAEICVVWSYSALTGGDAASIARHIASAVNLDGETATLGIAVHMALAVALGICLSVTMHRVPGQWVLGGMIFPFMIGGLVIIWAINFFVVLPEINPGFVQLLPYGVTFASKSAFGLAAAATLRAPMLARRWETSRPPNARIFDIA